jgi:hypothetical protein
VVWSAGCELQSVAQCVMCRVWGDEGGIESVECGAESVECGVGSGVLSVEC